MDEAGGSLWPGKFPTPASIEKAKRRINDHVTWMREFMQQIVAEEDQLVKPSDIHYYAPEDLPSQNIRMTVTSVDLASSQREAAAKTAILTAYVHGHGASQKIYILPIVTNQRMTFPEIIERLLAHSVRYPGRVVVEAVGSQEYVPQQLRANGIAVDSFTPMNDKYNRLYAISNLIANGTLLFPEAGCSMDKACRSSDSLDLRAYRI